MNARQHLWIIVRERRLLLLGGIFLLVVERACGLVLPASTKFLVDDIIGKHKLGLLLPLLLAVTAATAIQALASFTLNQTLARESQQVVARFRCRLQAHLSRLPVSYFDSTKTGTLLVRVMNDIEGIRNLIGAGMVQFAGHLLTSVIALVILARISLLMTAIIFGCVLALVFTLNSVFRTIQPIFQQRSKTYAEISGRLGESISGIRVVKGYHAEEREEQVFKSGVDRLTNVIMRTVTASSAMSMCATMALGMVTILVMYLGAHQIMANKLSLGGFVSYVVFMGMLVLPLGQITAVGGQVSEAFAGLRRASELLNERREDDDPLRTVIIPNIVGTVKFERVTFAYEASKPVLHDINFEARPGTVTALVGASGGGKSTVLGLVAAFYSAQDGKVLVDGIDLKTVQLANYRKALGVVFQESVLFDGSIRENVAFGAPHATDAEVLRACRIAHVDEFAERREEGYDTIIGERGVKLSGGQRQRISIARAILVNPRILILDEATSSLDSESEVFIQQGLMSLMEGRTTFVIAHRLSTVHRADQILVMEGGRIVETGTHKSLYALKGRYFELYTAQRQLGTDHLVDGKEQIVEAVQTLTEMIESNGLPGALKLVQRAT